MPKTKSYLGLTKELFDPRQIFEKRESLQGIRVLEVCHVVLGPAACDYLAEFGAEVIKFEGQGGDSMRFSCLASSNPSRKEKRDRRRSIRRVSRFLQGF